MVIGIKYCGGCNPGYVREELVKKLKERFPHHIYVTASERTECDIWLLVCGCSSACVSGEGLSALKKRFVLTSMKEFSKAEDYLKTESGQRMKQGKEKEKAETAGVEAGTVRYLRIGERASAVKTFYKEDADKFALLTGDNNRLHTDREFSERQWFGRPVVHGVLTASLLSTVMGTKMPGNGTILMSENLEFVNPVYFGDTVEAVVTFVSCRETKLFYVGEFYGECRNQRGETVVTGTVRQMMMKSLFCLTGGTKQEE